MLSSHDIEASRRAVENVLGVKFPNEIHFSFGEELSILWKGDGAAVSAPDQTAFSRACFLLTQAFIQGKTTLEITEHRHISSCGPFLDFSRGAVMTVSACKKYLDNIASLGLNLCVLYLEDTYSVPEYPYFGHLRGRYSSEELKEIDRYATSLGIELLPQIQTLAHLEQFLQWRVAEQLQDTPECLLVDEEETYKFIEAEIRAIRACFSTRRIHIGMDEAHNLGLMRYYAKHGPVDRFELLQRHLTKVCEICRKYDFHPMMWSDMFFRLGSKTNDYYDMKSFIPQTVIDNMPDVDMVYWDYYHSEPEWFEHMLIEHERMGKNTIFAGGIWTWSGFLPHVKHNNATMYPALKACAAHGVKTVMATMWGDDGNETDFFLALSQLAIFSEFCWRGPNCTHEEVELVAETLTGLPREVYAGFGEFYRDDQDIRTGKGLIYCDLLYHLLPENPDLEKEVERFQKGRQMLSKAADHPQSIYAQKLFDIAILKAKTILQIRRAYEKVDKSSLADVADKKIPALISLYEQFLAIHREQWLSSYKRNGWETFPLRYGAVIGRLKDTAITLHEYIQGTIKQIDELSEPLLDPTRRNGLQFYSVYVSPLKTL